MGTIRIAALEFVVKALADLIDNNRILPVTNVEPGVLNERIERRLWGPANIVGADTHQRALSE